MQSFGVLARLEQETRSRHVAAEHQRLGLMMSVATGGAYRSFLARVYGFESPVESAIALTPDIDALVDLRTRTGIKLLRSDLLALGVADPAQLPRFESVFPFRSPVDALGWMYVVERNASLHATLRGHLEQRLPDTLRKAGAYLAGNERAAGSRMCELANVLEGAARTEEAIDRIVLAAGEAFRSQEQWFAEVVRPRLHVA